MAYYSTIARSYDELHKEEQLNKIGIIKKNIQISKKTRILDVGCGTGISSDFECLVVGIDPSIELLRQNKRSRKLLGIAEALPFKDDSFDYVVSVTAIHNFSSIDKSIKEMKRVGKENFVISVLKKSERLACIKNIMGRNFRIDKAVEEEKDIIFFCKILETK